MPLHLLLPHNEKVRLASACTVYILNRHSFVNIQLDIPKFPPVLSKHQSITQTSKSFDTYRTLIATAAKFIRRVKGFSHPWDQDFITHKITAVPTVVKKRCIVYICSNDINSFESKTPSIRFCLLP